MKVMDAIRIIMKQTKTTQATMASRIGVKSQSVVAERLKQDNPTIDTVLEFLDQMGYELVIQERKRGKRAEGQIKIGGEE